MKIFLTKNFLAGLCVFSNLLLKLNILSPIWGQSDDEKSIKRHFENFFDQKFFGWIVCFFKSPSQTEHFKPNLRSIGRRKVDKTSLWKFFLTKNILAGLCVFSNLLLKLNILSPIWGQSDDEKSIKRHFENFFDQKYFGWIVCFFKSPSQTEHFKPNLRSIGRRKVDKTSLWKFFWPKIFWLDCVFFQISFSNWTF